MDREGLWLCSSRSNLPNPQAGRVSVFYPAIVRCGWKISSNQMTTFATTVAGCFRMLATTGNVCDTLEELERPAGDK